MQLPYNQKSIVIKQLNICNSNKANAKQLRIPPLQI